MSRAAATGMSCFSAVLTVRNSFNAKLVKAYAGEDMSISSAQMKCLRALYANDLETFFMSLKVFFVNIPYDISPRAPEEHTNEGLIDAVMETPDYVYVMEFKRDKPASEALDQINDKKYCESFLNSGKKIMVVGVNFDSEKCTTAEWVVEAL